MERNGKYKPQAFHPPPIYIRNLTASLRPTFPVLPLCACIGISPSSTALFAFVSLHCATRVFKITLLPPRHHLISFRSPQVAVTVTAIYRSPSSLWFPCASRVIVAPRCAVTPISRPISFLARFPYGVFFSIIPFPRIPPNLSCCHQKQRLCP